MWSKSNITYILFNIFHIQILSIPCFSTHIFVHDSKLQPAPPKDSHPKPHGSIRHRDRCPRRSQLHSRFQITWHTQRDVDLWMDNISWYIALLYVKMIEIYKSWKKLLIASSSICESYDTRGVLHLGSTIIHCAQYVSSLLIFSNFQ